ncbi:hypothetical protein ABNC90_20795 [Paenibacillus larvae]|uniref:Bacteriocin n=2 Tax=Paenibacillus larvae TaxID=1464 RepID=A0A2L1U045_9BACL|nr:hypothetical protein [Paenibacillus larvae]AQT86627.1 hypothetical protein B1222_23195 [Paenibacillus larvae subsp. pulvifaciens]AQZ48316.1 hypothetical protein B5S25_18735 [Paenibacillus larvae subsp. pulvifaciens]ARF66574.1 hypothetical protein B7C51_00325 [Paenibacillus larvae subsp. pulvifaciens]AVF26296.1 hypothetical protein ERICIII_02135 [Paenibacillus larvae subsp. larvae]AVF31073.1 hypothetical protein ERICIV_02156 [Paenibacillus larvae subsp. larvae]
MFELIASGISAGNAAQVINAVFNGLSIVSALSLCAGIAGGAAWFLSNGIGYMIKWAGKKTIIDW